ncbi:MAG: cobyrinate a,c-diamide synthase, partial [Propionibacteriaceae bacterium]|nr:cobyrinate a,c-diamide synthase [Propionibacteriaceae bacterium]
MDESTETSSTETMIGTGPAPKPDTTGRILITGTRSGAGKTTVTVAVIAALKARGLPVSAYKCGPDYIDPMFLSAALGVPAHNLDPFFCDATTLRHRLAAAHDQFAVIEGVMGYYDGLGSTSRASTFTVASATDTPVILVLDASGMAASAGAIMKGFASYQEPSGIAGVIVNRASERGYALIEPLIQEAGLTPLGHLPRTDSVTWPSRRLGLVTADELTCLNDSIKRLAELAEDHCDLDALTALGMRAPGLSGPEQGPRPGSKGSVVIQRMAAPGPQSSPGDVNSPGSGAASGFPSATHPEPTKRRVRLAVARDEAFCFIYTDTLDLFESLGAELIFFSPIADGLPPDCDGLYLPGGYPELHAEQLSNNRSMRATIASMIDSGTPTIAECGGFMYLHDEIDGHPMVGAIKGRACATPRLRRFGYTTLTADRDSLLTPAGATVLAHEFHYYESTDPGDGFTATKASTGQTYPCVHAT